MRTSSIATEGGGRMENGSIEYVHLNIVSRFVHAPSPPSRTPSQTPSHLLARCRPAIVFIDSEAYSGPSQPPSPASFGLSPLL